MHFLIVQLLDLGNLGKRVCFAYPSSPSSGQPFRRNALAHTGIYKLQWKTILTLHKREKFISTRIIQKTVLHISLNIYLNFLTT